MTATPEEQFRQAIEQHGLVPPEVIHADGKLHRFSPDGTRGGDAGWYVLHGDGLAAGAFGDWRSGEQLSWRADSGRKLAPVEAAAYAERIRQAQRQRDEDEAKRHADGAQLAQLLHGEASADVGEHPYAQRKRAALGTLVRRGNWAQRGWDDALLIPLYDAFGTITSIEAIAPDGTKDFLAGGRKRGCFHPLGRIRGAYRILIGEGLATVAACAEASGLPAVVAMDAGNLEPVAKAVRDLAPSADIVLLADHDPKPDGTNRGLEAAQAAAKAVGGRVAVCSVGESKSDFWDLWNERGAEAINEALSTAKAPDTSTATLLSPNAAAAILEGRIWPEPQPIRAELPPVPEFDANILLPAALRDWVMDEAKRMPCPPDFIAGTVLVGLGAAIGARCAIRPKGRDSWMVVPNLWGGVVALPSAKKSPAISAGMKPLARLAAKASEAHSADTQDFESERLVAEARRDAFKDDIKSAARKADGNPEQIAKALQEHNANAPTPPKMRRYSTNDSTVEKLGELLRDNPSGLLVLRDELVGLLASWDREGREGDRAFFLEAWNGNGSFDTDRIGRGSINIQNLCLSVFGGIQPDKLTGYLEQAADALGNDGMLQRFQVLLYPDAWPWEWRDQSPNIVARDAAMRLFEILADFDPVSWGATPADAVNRFPHFRFDDGAQAIFVEWATELHRVRIPKEQAEGHPLIAQHLAKYEKAFAAIALILHLAECADTGRRGAVSESAAMRAAAWCEYLEAHARRCYGLLADQGARAAQALAQRVRSGALSDGFTARDVRRKQWRHLGTDSAVRDALEWLEGEHWVLPMAATETATGRPTIRYAINPKSQKKGGMPTAITDETPLSAALAVPVPPAFAGKEAAHG